MNLPKSEKSHGPAEVRSVSGAGERTHWRVRARGGEHGVAHLAGPAVAVARFDESLSRHRLAVLRCAPCALRRGRCARFAVQVVDCREASRDAPHRAAPRPQTRRGEPWLVGRWLKWSQDKLNALDKSTAEALPAVERDVKRRVGRVALAITQGVRPSVPSSRGVPRRPRVRDGRDAQRSHPRETRRTRREGDERRERKPNRGRPREGRRRTRVARADGGEDGTGVASAGDHAVHRVETALREQKCASQTHRLFLRRWTRRRRPGGDGRARRDEDGADEDIADEDIADEGADANATVAAGGSARDESRARGALGARGCRARGVVGGAETDEASVVVARASIETHRRERASTSDGSRFGYESARVESSARVPGFRGGGDGARGGGVVDRGGGAGAPADDDARRALGGDDGAARAASPRLPRRPRRFRRAARA